MTKDRARCEGCGFFPFVEDLELEDAVEIYPETWEMTYSHYIQIAIDDFRRCGPVVIYGEDDEH